MSFDLTIKDPRLETLLIRLVITCCSLQFCLLYDFATLTGLHQHHKLCGDSPVSPQSNKWKAKVMWGTYVLCSGIQAQLYIRPTVVCLYVPTHLWTL